MGNCAIKADVHRTNDHKIQAAIVFIHGGGLIAGGRTDHAIIIEMLANAGYTVISIDYRLAPEIKLRSIIEDLRDALNWVWREGPTLFNIDQDRIGVVGNSAGGFLTLMSGFAVDYRPKALVSMYGYGDIAGDWAINPSSFYCKQPFVSKSIACAEIGTQTISESSPEKHRFSFYLYCRQQGIWVKEVTGHDPHLEPEVFNHFRPINNVTASYPPTLLLHGDMDTDVPYEQSVAMAKKLKNLGIEHQLVTVLGKEHLFEKAGFSDPIVSDALHKVLVFLQKQI